MAEGALEMALERLRRRAEGLLLVSVDSLGTEIAFCGVQNGEYEGWRERAYADAMGFDYRGEPDTDVAILLAAYDEACVEAKRWHGSHDGLLQLLHIDGCTLPGGHDGPCDV